MAKQSKVIRGYTVDYDSEAKEGIDHLVYVLSLEERDSLLKAAQRAGEVKFEDRMGRNFVLKRKSLWKFTLEKRKGWW